MALPESEWHPKTKNKPLPANYREWQLEKLGIENYLATVDGFAEAYGQKWVDGQRWYYESRLAYLRTKRYRRPRIKDITNVIRPRRSSRVRS